MSRRLACAISILTLVVCASPVAAQERIRLDLSTALSGTAVVPPVVMTVDQLPVAFNGEYPRQQPSTLMRSLYVSTAVMQALDVHSTLRALDNGAIENNPLMTQVSRNKTAFIALKAGVALSTVMAARHMSKRNKVAAALTLIAINSAYAMVVNHNYRVARGGR